MRHPLWILNSSLFLLFIAVLVFIVFSREKLPIRESIEPDEYGKPIIKEPSKINIGKIYEYDLFDTYKKEFLPPREADFIPPVPEPPAPQPTQIPEPPKPTFLDPLNITLKGIIIVAHEDTKSRVIVVDNKTNREAVYKIGDMLEDAQLIRIFNNKVIFIRSNGQQEILYLRPKDAELDPAYALINIWGNVVQKDAEDQFRVNVTEFTRRIKNLAQLIDLLDLITAYKQGKSIGCRIGTLEKNSLGSALGLQSGDIILTINDIPATDTAHRFEIYKQIITLNTEDEITVLLQRNKQEVTLNYTVHDFKPAKPTETVDHSKTPEPQMPDWLKPGFTKEQIKLMEERLKFAPTVQEIKKREKESMLHKGKRNHTE